MSNAENIRGLMEKMAQGKEAANFAITFDEPTRRLKVVPAGQVANKDVLKVSPEDMKVS